MAEDQNYPDFVEKKLSKKKARLGRYMTIRGNLFLGTALGIALYIFSGDKTTRYVALATAGFGAMASVAYKGKINELERKIEEDRRTLMMGGVIEDE